MRTPSFDVKILVEKVRIIRGYLRYSEGFCNKIRVNFQVRPRTNGYSFFSCCWNSFFCFPWKNQRLTNDLDVLVLIQEEVLHFQVSAKRKSTKHVTYSSQGVWGSFVSVCFQQASLHWRFISVTQLSRFCTHTHSTALFYPHSPPLKSHLVWRNWKWFLLAWGCWKRGGNRETQHQCGEKTLSFVTS